MIRTFHKGHCWQYESRLKHAEGDLMAFRWTGIGKNLIPFLRIRDFTFQHELKDDVFPEIKTFIEKHEWLGKMSLWPTHVFTARLKGVLAGVVVMDMPPAFSKLLGDDTRKVERLISRGACISWSPKNLASSLVMYSIRWMAQNTPYRIFTSYADPEANELGTIYQACNFNYLGQKSGTKFQYKTQQGQWVSDRYFRCRSIYKRVARVLDIEWKDDWQSKTNRNTIFWENVPEKHELSIRRACKTYMQSCERREVMPKHKYAYIQGGGKGETRRLRAQFNARNETYPYPKERGT